MKNIRYNNTRKGKIIFLSISLIVILIIIISLDKKGILNKQKAEKRELQEEINEHVQTAIMNVKEKEESLNNEITLENMKKQESFQGWDFTSGSVWKMEEFPELIFSFQIEGEQ